MSGSNPFEEDPDDFASQARLKNSSSYNPTPSSNNVLQQKIKASMDRQIESTNRCLAGIYDSENIGVSTAEELVLQGEKLDNAERNVDKILSNTRQSQKHLNNIKSVFGGFKNWLSGEKKDSPSNPPTQTRDRSHSNLTKAMNSLNQIPREQNPVLVSKGYNSKSFYDDDIVEFKDFDPEKMESQSKLSFPTNQKPTSTNIPVSKNSSGRSELWQQYEMGLDKNLNLMSNGLSNLKMLAQGLGDEIEAQNAQLDRINDKVDKSDNKIRNQNVQMKHILGK